MHKNVSKTILVVLILSCTWIPYESCKKGSGDPFISFRSRKARVAGDWTVTKQNVSKTTVTTYNVLPLPPNTETVVDVCDGSITTETKSGTNYPVNEISTMKETIAYSFKKDGTWSSTDIQVLTFHDTCPRPPDDLDYARTTVNTVTTESSGKWDFNSGVGDDKKKEKIILDLTKQVTTTIHGESYALTFQGEVEPEAYVDDHFVNTNEFFDSQEIWTLTELKNKSMKASGKGHSSSSITKNGLALNVSVTEDETFSIELEAK